MRIPSAAIVLTLALLIVPGCRSTSVARRAKNFGSGSSTQLAQSERARDAKREAQVPAKTAETDPEPIKQVSAETSSDVVEYSTAPSTPVSYSIRTAIETALAHNPDLIALRQTDPVGTAALGVAQTYPFNPFVQVQATPYQSAPRQSTDNQGSGTTYHYVLLMQQIQLGGQQQFREQAASATLNGIRWTVLQAELVNVAQTERLYFAALYQQGLRDLANLNAENNRQLLAILEKQQESGQATASDVAIVRLDARSTRQQQRIAEANYQTALLDLKRHLCLPSDTKITLDNQVLSWNWQPATTAQLTTMAANRPDVMAARADADTARANTSLADGSRIPDLQIGPYYQRTDTGITYLGFRGQMDLPFVNDGTPLLRQRQAELCQRATVSQQLATRATLEAEAAADRYERARQLRSESTESPQTSVPIELQRLEEQFLANEVDILRVMQARTSLLQSQRADLDALNELMQAAVAVTVASGVPLESLTAPATTETPSENP